MRTFHINWAYVVVVLNLIVGLWGLLFLRKRERAPRSFWYAIGAGQLALAVQVGLGLALTQQFGNPPGLHMFYGFVVLIAAILTYAFRGEGARRTILVFSSAAVFIGAVSIRAMITG